MVGEGNKEKKMNGFEELGLVRVELSYNLVRAPNGKWLARGENGEPTPWCADTLEELVDAMKAGHKYTVSSEYRADPSVSFGSPLAVGRSAASG